MKIAQEKPVEANIPILHHAHAQFEGDKNQMYPSIYSFAW